MCLCRRGVNAGGSCRSWGRPPLLELGEGSRTREVTQEELGETLGCSLDRSRGEFGSWEQVEGVSSLLQMAGDVGFWCKSLVLLVGRLWVRGMDGTVRGCEGGSRGLTELCGSARSRLAVGVDAEVARWAAGEDDEVGEERSYESGKAGGRACRVSGFIM